MGDYTKLNLKADVEDMAPKFGFAPDMEYRVGRSPLETAESALSYLRLAPGYRMPFGHTHERQEEVYVLLSGTAKLKLDDEIAELRPLDAVRIAAETMRNLEAGPDGAELLLFGAPNTGENDAEMTQDWWPKQA
jgi:mannose-6-phosphate isomerase-like protein (cupin superfamily)